MILWSSEEIFERFDGCVGPLKSKYSILQAEVAKSKVLGLRFLKATFFWVGSSVQGGVSSKAEPVIWSLPWVKGKGMALVYGASVRADFVRSSKCSLMDFEVFG